MKCKSRKNRRVLSNQGVSDQTEPICSCFHLSPSISTLWEQRTENRQQGSLRAGPEQGMGGPHASSPPPPKCSVGHTPVGLLGPAGRPASCGHCADTSAVQVLFRFQKGLCSQIPFMKPPIRGAGPCPQKPRNSHHPSVSATAQGQLAGLAGSQALSHF